MRWSGPLSALEFDYVIVGGGTAGCVLANRLSADPSRSVCLVEAGGDGRSPLISTPLAVLWLMRHKTWDWGYSTVPQPALDGREVIVPRGRALGGSSAINGMVYVRGLPSDYDGWAGEGCTGWSYDEVLPYFRRSERNDSFGAPYHGTEGEIPVSHLADPNPAIWKFLEAAESLQLPRCEDLTGPRPEGVGRYQTYTGGGRRVSAAEGFVRPVEHRANLHVMNATATRRILVEDGRATGIETDRGTIRARAEVILSAGAIGSPHLLQLSGLGPAAHLAEHGIPVVRDLPGVGSNFHDHPNVMLSQRARGQDGYGLSLRSLPGHALGLLNYFYRRRGMWASMICEAGGFARVTEDPEPDVQFHFAPFWRSATPGRVFAWGHGYALHVCKLRPLARGSVRLAAPDPAAAPLIDPNLLGHEADMATMLAGVKLARRILNASPLAETKAYEALPGDAVQDDDGLRAFLRARTNTIFHPVGSCRMGTDPGAVVDPELRLRGLDGLRVVDASIMPRVVSGNTNAAAMMIAEKAADMILGRPAPARATEPATAPATSPATGARLAG